MHPCLTTARRATQRCALVVILLLAGMLAGCGRADGPIGAAAQPPRVQATERPTPTLSSLDQTKQAIDERMAHEIQTAAVRPTSQTPPPLPDDAFVIISTGLTTDCETLFTKIVIPSSCWLDLVDGKYLFFVAGVDGDNPNAGKIGFYTALPNATVVDEFFRFLTPTQHGAVTITAVAPPLFTVEAEDGTVFVFNVDTRQWEDSGSTPVPPR